MKGVKKLGNPAETTVNNYLQVTNAVADQQLKSGNREVKFLSAANAKKTYGQMLKTVIAFANPANPKHNEAHNALKDQLGNSSEALNDLESVGEKALNNVRQLAQSFDKRGLKGQEAIDGAFNSMMGNPVYDHFGNLNLLSGQLFEEQIFIENFIAKGDAFSVPAEAGGTGTALSRFRVPIEKITGSAKKYQGDINPQGRVQHDNNRIQHSLFNEFKNANTLDAVFSITQDQRDQALGYQKAVSPSLAGFILQNRYFSSSQKFVLKLAEALFVDGLDSAGIYTPNVGGSYGLLSPAIQLQLASYNVAQPLPASTADWLANPTKLIQKIQNFYAKPADITLPLPNSLGTDLMYKDIVRLLTLAALNNVNFSGKWTLYVPASWYGLAVQYPASGTFNKQLIEMVKGAIGDKIITSIEILPSSLLDARTNMYGVDQPNYMAAVAHGAETEKKPVIMPGQTAVPTVVADNVNSQLMEFTTKYQFGGPMVTQYGGAFLLEFSLAA